MIKIRQKQTTLGGDAVRLTISKVIALAITMVNTMLLSRFRTYYEYGTYSQLLIVINLFTAMFMLGLPNSINYFLSRADTNEERRLFLSVYYTLSTVLSLLIGFLLVATIPLVEAYFHNSLIRRFAYFLALYPWSHIISSSIENLLVVYKKTRFLMVFRITHSSAMLGTVVLVQMLGFGFNEYMFFFIAVNCFFALFVYAIAINLSGGINLVLDKSLIRAIFVFSIPMGLASVVCTWNAEIDKLLIGYLMDTEELAIYTNAAKELPLTIVSASVTAVLLPQLTRMAKLDRGKEALRLWGYATEFAFIIIALIVAGVIVYAREVMIILYSEKYLPGIQVFRIYTLVLLLQCTYFGIILNAYGKTRDIFYCSLITLALNALLNPIFYWLLGMIGPAIATFMSILTIQMLQLRMTAHTVGIPFLNVFPWKNLGRVILVNIGFALVFCFLKQLMPLQLLVGEIIESILLGVFWAFVYLFFMRNSILKLWRLINHDGETINLKL